jgi:hypothetical protein
MSYVLTDRVKQKCSVTGTGAVTLGASILGFRRFSEVAAPGDVFHYMLINITNGEWEAGIGTLSIVGLTETINRAAMSSSNNNATVSFTAGEKEIFIALLSENVVYTDDQSKVRAGNTYLTLDKINGFPATDGDAGQVLSTTGEGSYQWVDQASGGGSSVIKTFNVLNDFAAPLLGKAIYVPEANRTVRSVRLANSVRTGADLMVGLYRNDALLQFFTIPAGQITATYSGLNYTINTTDYIKVNIVAGAGSNFTLTLLSV